MRWCDTPWAESGTEAYRPLNMKKKHNFFIEKYLVPVALCLLNICLVHVVYVYAAGPMYPALSKLTVTVTLVLLAGSLAFKKKTFLASSILLYAIVVIVV